MRVERSRGIRVERLQASSRIPGYSPSVENNAAFASLRPPMHRVDELPWKLRSNIYPFLLSPRPSPPPLQPRAFVWVSALPWSRCLLVSGNFATIESLVSNLFNPFFLLSLSFFFWYGFLLLSERFNISRNDTTRLLQFPHLVNIWTWILIVSRRLTKFKLVVVNWNFENVSLCRWFYRRELLQKWSQCLTEIRIKIIFREISFFGKNSFFFSYSELFNEEWKSSSSWKTRLKSSNFSKEYFQIPTIFQEKETKSKYPRRRSVNLDNIQQLEHNVTITSISIRKPEENCPKEKVYDYSYDQIMISRSNNDPPLRRIRRNTSVLR